MWKIRSELTGFVPRTSTGALGTSMALEPRSRTFLEVQRPNWQTPSTAPKIICESTVNPLQENVANTHQLRTSLPKFTSE